MENLQLVVPFAQADNRFMAVAELDELMYGPNLLHSDSKEVNIEERLVFLADHLEDYRRAGLGGLGLDLSKLANARRFFFFFFFFLIALFLNLILLQHPYFQRLAPGTVKKYGIVASGLAKNNQTLEVLKNAYKTFVPKDSAQWVSFRGIYHADFRRLPDAVQAALLRRHYDGSEKLTDATVKRGVHAVACARQLQV
jgi:hypothetical protein